MRLARTISVFSEAFGGKQRHDKFEISFWYSRRNRMYFPIKIFRGTGVGPSNTLNLVLTVYPYTLTPLYPCTLTRVPSCNTRKRMKLPQRASNRNHLCGRVEINRCERAFVAERSGFCTCVPQRPVALRSLHRLRECKTQTDERKTS